MRSFLKLSAVLFLVKVAYSASCRVEKCDDLEKNLKMSLNVIRILMSNRHISLKWVTDAIVVELTTGGKSYVRNNFQ